MRPSLSVVIPVLDDAVALQGCLRRLEMQTAPPLEVVVVDNGCADHSARVATEAGARVVREPVRGIPAAAATGYDAARGEVIVRCDADTRPGPDWLDRIAAAFARDADLMGLTGAGRFYDLPRRRARLAEVFYLRGYYTGVHAALAGVPLWGSNMALRRSCWQQVSTRVHRTERRVHDDIDLSFQLPPGALVRYDPELVVGVSGRMFHSRAATARRFDWALHTMRLNWQHVPPWQRWARRLRFAGSPRAGSAHPDPDEQLGDQGAGEVVGEQEAPPPPVGPS